MSRIVRVLAPLAVAGAVLVTAASAEAGCVKKAGSGTGGNKDSAMFQAWEAVLQATSWGSWAQFMSSGMKIGTAPGYKVSGFMSSCKPGGLGQTCYTQATLCN